MPKFRSVYIENQKTLSNSGTQVIELAVVDPISEIHIKFAATNGSTSNKNNPIAKNISKIEIVDGSNVIYSLNGFMAQAMSYYQRAKTPSMVRAGGPDAVQEDHFIIRFGRWLWDKDFALVPSKFRNLQLKITWALDIAVTTWATGTGKLTIIAKIMEDMASDPNMFMMAKSHYSWTTAASGEERIALPSDHPYALLLFRAWETDVALDTTITNLKLSLDQDKDIPFDLSAADFLRSMENEFGLIDIKQSVFAGTEVNIQTWLGSSVNINITSESAPAGAGVTNTYPTVYGVGSGHVNTVLTDSAGTDDVDSILQMICRGQALNHCFAHKFGEIKDPDSYLQAPDYGDIKMILTQGNAGAAGNLALLQAKQY